jgi:hypothetical protein
MQSPVQAPSVQRFGQAGMLRHNPSVPHSRGTRAAHCLLPGLHSPPQALPEQMNWQVMEGSQVPLSLHASRTLLAPQRLVPGMQSPPQLPLEQMLGQTAPFTHAPASSQTCVVKSLGLLQRLMPGLHVPVHRPIPVQAFGQGMASRTHSP